MKSIVIWDMANDAKRVSDLAKDACNIIKIIASEQSIHILSLTYLHILKYFFNPYRQLFLFTILNYVSINEKRVTFAKTTNVVRRSDTEEIMGIV